MNKKILLVMFLLFFAVTFLNAQQKSNKSFPVSTKSTDQIKPVGIDTHPNLIKLEKNMQALVEANRGMLKANRMNKTTAAVSYEVGDSRNLWTYDLENGTFYQTASTCRGVGTYCDVFVEDSVWGGRVDQNAVDNVIEAFDNSTPGNSGSGIFETVTGVFGECPDIDGDEKIIILILNIKDGYTIESGSYTAGYFYPVNQYTQEELNEMGASNYKTNEAEIFYMDCNPAYLLSTAGLDDVLSTTAHEFQHMVHWNYHGNPEVASLSQGTFFNEGCSQLAPYLCGYGLPNVSRYLANANDCALTDWDGNGRDVLIDYSRCTLYFLYLYEQFGEDFIRNFVSNSYAGSMAINDELENIGSTRTYDDIFTDWAIANALNDKSVDPKWGYDYEGTFPLATGDLNYSVNIDESYDLYGYASQYITFAKGEDITITPTADNSTPIFKAVEISELGSKVVDIASGESFTEPEFTSQYELIKLIAINNASNASGFDVTTTGTEIESEVEISYDSEYDSSYYFTSLTAGVKQAVVFDGVSSSTLSTLRFLLLNTEPIVFNIYEFSGSKTSPLGPSLGGPYTVTPDSNNQWIDFSVEDSISAGSDFVVVFNISTAISEGGNEVKATKKSGEEYSHSLFFLPATLQDTPGWYYLTDGEGNTWLNRIRAYVSVITDVEEEVEATPKEFALTQNYPNPFNPTTTISYSLPEAAKVQLKVYDLMGREVKSLLNEEKAAGSYNITWDGTNKFGQKVASGIYFYRVKAGKFNAAKKMIMLK